MIPLFAKTNPIQTGELPSYQTALDNTQGNILKGHGRKQTVNVFLSFTADASKLKPVIRGLSSQVTSASAQAQQTQKRKDDGTESLFVGFGLSSSGYAYLGFDKSKFNSQAFRDGMTRLDSGLNDPPTSAWEAKYQAPLHATVLLAHADPAALSDAVDNLTARFAGLANISTELGVAIHNGTEPVEQFGFVDGISQPLFFQSDVPPISAPVNWDTGAGTNLVLTRDPFGASDDDCGSYLVFRKLQQDVDGFKQKEAELQSKLSPDQDPGLAGAFVVGRFRDGTPVALHPAPLGLATPENNFIYRGKPPAVSADPYELRCPVSSHLRKVNPRGDTSSLASERTRRIARRGITYGIQGADAEVGLLFQCCQSSLEDQFEFIQATWSNRTGRPSGSAESIRFPVSLREPIRAGRRSISPA